jgi:ABC-2 type transport system ATP-binding protein
MIRAEGLTKYYERRCVVRDVSFTIADREIVGFLGLNGAGKTTALRMLAGLLMPSAGRIEIDGRDLLDDPLAMRWRIGFLPERPPLYEDMSVGGYLTFSARLRGYDEARLSSRVDEVIGMTALESYRGELISTLSHGFRQRLGIAQAIVHDPKLVILDEPINGLDPVQIVEMRKLIRSLKERHTVLVSSHILTEISQTCDRLLIIHQGALVAEGPESDLALKLSGDKRQVLLGVIGDRDTLEVALKSTPIVVRWEIIGGDGGVHELRVDLSQPAPEMLAEALVRAGLGLRRLEPVKSELETTFLQLTGARA